MQRRSTTANMRCKRMATCKKKQEVKRQARRRYCTSCTSLDPDSNEGPVPGPTWAQIPGPGLFG